TSGQASSLSHLRYSNAGRSETFASEGFVAADRGADFLAQLVIQGDQALLGQVAVGAPGFFTGELGKKLLDARHHADVGFLDVEIERPGDTVGFVADGLESGFHPFDGGAAHLVAVLVEEAEAEHAEGI